MNLIQLSQWRRKEAPPALLSEFSGTYRSILSKSGTSYHRLNSQHGNNVWKIFSFGSWYQSEVHISLLQFIKNALLPHCWYLHQYLRSQLRSSCIRWNLPSKIRQLKESAKDNLSLKVLLSEFTLSKPHYAGRPLYTASPATVRSHTNNILGITLRRIFSIRNSHSFVVWYRWGPLELRGSDEANLISFKLLL